MFQKAIIFLVFVSVCSSLSYDGHQDYLSSGTSQSLLGTYPSLGYSPNNYLSNSLLGNQYSQFGTNGLPFGSLGYNSFNRGIYPGLLNGYDSGLLQGTSGLLQGTSGLLQGTSGLLQGSGILQGSGNNYLDQLPFTSNYNYQGLGNRFPSLTNFGRTTIDGTLSGILREYRQDPLDGSYAFGFESDNGIRRQEAGTSIDPSGAVIKRGSYSFTHPDGTPANYNYIADENGFRIRSNLLPTLQNGPLSQGGLQALQGASGLFDDDSNLLRSSFIDSHRQNSLPLLSSRSVSGRVNDFDDLAYRNSRASSAIGRGRGPFVRNIHRDTFDASDPHTGGSTLSGHVKRENKNQDLKLVNEKREVKIENKSNA